MDINGGTDKVLKRLNAAGIDTDKAIEYSFNDPDFYMEIMGDYVDAFEEKKSLLDEYYSLGEWHEFELMVHAIKSTSKMIGLMDFSEEAAKLEKAAWKSDVGYISRKYEGFIRNYREVTELIRNCIGAQ